MASSESRTDDTLARDSKAGDQMNTVASDAMTAAAPYIDKAKAFAKSKPYATAALAGVLGIALLNTLRGKGRA